MLATVSASRVEQRTAGLLAFVLIAFAANSLVTRYVVANHLLDAYLLTVVRFVAGASPCSRSLSVAASGQA